MDDFAVFILSYKRVNSIVTLKALSRAGYTGRIYILVGSDDEQLLDYQRKYKDMVIVYDKREVINYTDIGDNFLEWRSDIYGRNACFGIAERLGVKKFLVLDDDYISFEYKVNSDAEGIHGKLVRNINKIFMAMVEYQQATVLKSIAFAQGGDYMGGLESDINESINRRRKCMNTFFCSVDKMFRYVGRMNDDVNTYVWYQSVGNLFLTMPLVIINQKETQNNAGGMTELYIDLGTYVKSFYTVMYAPSSVKVGIMHSRHPRLHHIVTWDNAVPCIIQEEYCKGLAR